MTECKISEITVEASFKDWMQKLAGITGSSEGTEVSWTVKAPGEGWTVPEAAVATMELRRTLQALLILDAEAKRGYPEETLREYKAVLDEYDKIIGVIKAEPTKLGVFQ